MKNPPLPVLNRKLWSLFSKYIRLKDANKNGGVYCFTCGLLRDWKQMDAGHFIAKSISLFLRFNELNVHPQCTGCNRFRHGNLVQYALALQKKYGENILNEIDDMRKDHQNFKMTRSDYLSKIEEVKYLLTKLQDKI